MLPKDIVSIIMDYKYSIEQYERKQNVHHNIMKMDVSEKNFFESARVKMRLPSEYTTITLNLPREDLKWTHGWPYFVRFVLKDIHASSVLHSFRKVRKRTQKVFGEFVVCKTCGNFLSLLRDRKRQFVTDVNMNVFCTCRPFIFTELVRSTWFQIRDKYTDPQNHHFIHHLLETGKLYEIRKDEWVLGEFVYLLNGKLVGTMEEVWDDTKPHQITRAFLTKKDLIKTLEGEVVSVDYFCAVQSKFA